MPATPVLINDRPARVHKAILAARFQDQTVLASDFWSYVELWLRRKQSRTALFYWVQAKQFYLASEGLSPVSSPLTLYYCFLNATKALLEQRGIASAAFHGTSGKSSTKKATLSGEQIEFQARGIAPALGRLFSDIDTRSTYNLKQVLYNLPFIHRAYILTFERKPELFLPIREPLYVCKEGSEEAWVQMETEPKFPIETIREVLPLGYEHDLGIRGKTIFRRKHRFRWKQGEYASVGNLARISAYNQKVRRDILYIRGQPPTWYLRLARGGTDVIQRSTISLMLAAMHRLSELARYDPLRLQLLLETQQNWLISEFIGSAPAQFLDEIATEMTGQNLALPFVRGVR